MHSTSESCKQCDACVVLQYPDARILDWARRNSTNGGLIAKQGEGEDAVWTELIVETWDSGTVHVHIERCRANLGNGAEVLCELGEIAARITEFIIVAPMAAPCAAMKNVLKLLADGAEPEDVAAAKGLKRLTPPNSVLLELANQSQPPPELLGFQEERPW
ncbi:MAG TPA: hypothetical protein VND64_29595 [Pirellulales bacterium]|nr:hypothetical protein [Pirellulales bacterium]